MPTSPERTPEPPAFEELYRSAPCGLLTMTSQGEVIEVNDTFLAWTGADRDAVLGAQFSALLDVGSQLFYETRHSPVLRLRGEVTEVSLSLRCSDGTAIPVLINAVVAPGADVVRVALFGTSGRKEFERELLAARRAAEASEARVRVLQDVSSALGGITTSRSVAEALVATARRAFTAPTAAVLLRDASGRGELVAGVNHVGAALARLEGEAMTSGAAVTIANLDDAEALYPQLANPMRDARLEALSVAPLLDDGVAFGVLVTFFARRQSFDAHFVDLQEALAREASQAFTRVRLLDELARLASHDQLTGLANRVLVQSEVARALAAANERGRPLAVLFLDLDGFKAVNDQLGHAAGDEVLRDVAGRLEGCVRSGDTIGRFGGDEFVAICPGADASAARLIAKRIVDAVAQPFAAVTSGLPVSASIGVAIVDPGLGSTRSGNEVIAVADGAMYRSKSAGTGRVTIVAC